MARILVTGAFGYIGGHLVPALRGAGYDVRCVGHRGRASAHGEPNAGLVDVTRFDEVRAVVAGADTVVHLAALPVNRSFEYPVDDFEVNALGTFYVLAAAREAGVKKLVFASSSEVYGIPRTRPIEETHPRDPVSPYGASKKSGEDACAIMHRVFGLPTVVLRLFNVYGRAADLRERPTVETLYLKAVLADRAPVITAHPESAKDFVHIADVVRGIRLAIDSDAAVGETINIGAGAATSLLALAQHVVRLTGASASPEILPVTSPPTVYEADIRKAGRLLGYRPAIGLDEGLREIHDSLRELKT